VLVGGSREISSADHIAQFATTLARQLPDRPAALNLCERRDNFLIAFMALLMREQVCLLPPSRAPAVVDEVEAQHPESYRLDDDIVDDALAARTAGWTAMPAIPLERIVVIGYTSGSTGRPQANPKTWRALAAVSSINAARIRAALRDPDAALPSIVATVPPQHMYGLETSVLLPLLGNMGIHRGRPLYPADVAAALAELSEPRILVSTPLHLRALLLSKIALPPLEVVVSATAPLNADVAKAMEQRCGAALLEFFGSTETCVIASRRTASESVWHSYPGVTLQPSDDATLVDASWFPAPVLLQDMLEVRADGKFVVLGRNADMVEVGGKRASLADLTRRLLAVPGVADAVVFQPDSMGSVAVQRLAALVVADDLTAADVLRHLAASVDPVFLPRPLVFVPQLPRNELGKLPRDRLLAALER